MNVIDSQIGTGRQDVKLTEILDADGTKLKIEIRSDSYDFQCYAKISILDMDERKWNVLHSIHHSNMKTPEGLVYHPKCILSQKFGADRRQLIKVAKDLVKV